MAAKESELDALEGAETDGSEPNARGQRGPGAEHTDMSTADDKAQTSSDLLTPGAAGMEDGEQKHGPDVVTEEPSDHGINPQSSLEVSSDRSNTDDAINQLGVSSRLGQNTLQEPPLGEGDTPSSSNEAGGEGENETRRSSSVLETERDDTKRPSSVLESERDDTKRPPSDLETERDDTKRPSSVLETERDETKRPQSVLETERDDTKRPPSILEGEGDDTKRPSSVLEGEGDETKRPSSVLEGEGDETKRPPSVLETERDETKRPPSVLESERDDTKRPSSVLEGEGDETKRPSSVLEGEGDETKRPSSVLETEKVETNRPSFVLGTEGEKDGGTEIHDDLQASLPEVTGVIESTDPSKEEADVSNMSSSVDEGPSGEHQSSRSEEEENSTGAKEAVEETVQGQEIPAPERTEEPTERSGIQSATENPEGISSGEVEMPPGDRKELGELSATVESSPDVDSKDSVAQEDSDHPKLPSAGEPKEEDGETPETEDTIPENLFYDYEKICSQPYITPDSGIPNNVLQLLHSFGYDCTRRANLHLLDDQTLLYVAGTTCVILTLKPPGQRYLRSSGGGGIGAIAVHPSKKYFAVAEKGHKPNIIIYEFPSLRPYRILRGGTEEAYTFADFNASGTLLASVGSSPDYMLTLWDWRQEKITLRSKASSQDVFQVTFSAENERQLTTCGTGHIKFWKMARTFTGLKLQGELGRFGKTALTDIEGYVELPDGKVISGSEWGNLLLWEGGLIKVELCRKGRRPCHNGPINQFVLDEGELITIGTDGYVRVWDFETVDTADSVDDSGLLEMEPMNELLVGKHVNLRFMVKAMDPDSPVWFAQDANGAVWKLDLSFSNITQDPERLFSFHSGSITALDASPSTHLMASTSLDRSVRVYDFVGKNPLAELRFKQGGTSLVWAPRMVNPKGGLFAAGFEDGVVRILEVYNPQGFRLVAGRTGSHRAEINLKQAFKPHTAPVTALAYERNGEILATGSEDKTVFFFAVGEKYEPIGFVCVPGPVRELHWSPPSHEQNTLLVLCKNGCAVQIPAPAAEKRDPAVTYEITDLRLQHFRFCSIRSKIEREEELARRREAKEKKRQEMEAKLKQQKGVELTEEDLQLDTEEEEEPLPPLYVPEEPSPILCGFYASPGEFWLSLDGYDSGFLYLCKFSEDQAADPSTRRDEPRSALPIENSAHNPIHKVHFSSSKRLLFCGMQDGAVRVYPLRANDPSLDSMQGYWSLGIHDNQYGQVRAICCSYDNQYLVTCGADSNIFTFSILSMEDIERDLKAKTAKVPSPRGDLEREKPAEDIDDPNAYSIENAKQKRQHDLMVKAAEQMKANKRQTLERLRNEFRLLLRKNSELPAHMQLSREEFEMDHRIREEMERQTSERIRTVMKELAWEQEKHSIALKKLQSRFRDNVEFDTVRVRGINSDHQVSTYRLLSLSDKYCRMKETLGKRRLTRHELHTKEATKDGYELAIAEHAVAEPKEVAIPLQKQRWPGRPRAGGRSERIRKIVEKTEMAKSKISQRKMEWEELYKKKPSDDYEDPQDVLAIKNAKENMGDFKLKTAADYTVPEHLRINAERKRSELAMLEDMIHERKSAMNHAVLALRDFKADTIKEIQKLAEEVKLIQSELEPSKRLPVPPVPRMLPDEVPENKFRYDRDTLQRFKSELENKSKQSFKEGAFGGFGSFGAEENTTDNKGEMRSVPSSLSTREGSPTGGSALEEEKSELEKDIEQINEIRNMYKQKSLIEKINELVTNFDAELRVLRHEKLKLDVQMKMGDLRHVTLFEELLLLKEFEKREDILQEKVSDRISEKEDMKAKSEEYLQQLEAKKREIVKLQEQEKALHSTFQASLGENNKFAAFLTKVFKKKIKRTKKKETRGDEEEEEESEEDSDEESTWESDEDESGSEEGVFDDSVCPENCDPTLFENTLQLRERRLDIEEALAEEKKLADNLKKECDALAKKGKIVDMNLSVAEKELDAFQREKQQKLNELHVVVPLKLHQVDYTVNGEIPGDLSQALVFSHQSLDGLQRRIEELQREKLQQRELYREAREQHKQLIRDKKEMEAQIRKLQEKCHQQMMMKFGRLVDLEALQTLSVNVNLEELRIKSLERGQEMDKEIGQWEAKVTEVKRELMEVTREQTRKLEKINELLSEQKALEEKLDARQTCAGEEFRGPRGADIREKKKLLQMVEIQAEEIGSLKEEISLLSKKGGSILPPAHPPAPRSSGTVA